jgi:hypothetical protein
VLCIKCILSGVPVTEKLSDEQTNAILDILGKSVSSTHVLRSRLNYFAVLDTKLEMTVLSIENDIPHVQLNLGERSLNSEIRAIVPPSASPAMVRHGNPS